MKKYLAGVMILSSAGITLSSCNARRGMSMESVCVELLNRDTLYMDVTPEQTQEILRLSDGSVRIIDVRRSGEFDSFRISNSINVNYDSENFREIIDTFPRECLYLLYCKHGARSSSAATIMKELNFIRVLNLSGGIKSWIQLGYPVE